MRTILLGQPGSGKTTEILAAVRERLQRGDAAFRLVTPTATMAEHLRNQLARSGLLVRPKSITTIARFVRELAPDLPAAAEAEIRLLVASILADRKPASLAGLLESRGLCDALARAFEELANAGCGSLQWQALAGLGVQSGTVLRDFGSLYSAFEEALQQRGLLLRPQQVLAAARQAPTALAKLGIDTVYLDGFFSFTQAERELVAAVASRASMLVALPEWTGAQLTLDSLRQRGFRVQRLPVVRASARRVVVACPDGPSMVSETARRIRALQAAGVPWRDIGIIVRAAEPWAPQIEAALARFGIPCRAYFAAPLTRHPIYHLLSSALRAAAGGFVHSDALHALISPAGLAGESPARDLFEYEVRNHLPGQGLDSLRAFARKFAQPGHPLLAALAILRRFEESAVEPAPPAEWPARIAVLHGLVAGPHAAGPVDAASLTAWRSRAAALRGFQAALVEAARLLPDEPITLERFWSLAAPALDEVSLRPATRDRDAVALLDVQEARQWELPHVFLCGLIEGEFPRIPRPDCILDDEIRQRLYREGFSVSRLSDREAHESFLFDVALSRATEQVVLLYPARDGQGEQTLPSFEVQRMDASRDLAVPVRLEAGSPPPPVPVRQSIQDAALHDVMREKHKLQRPTAIEAFLRCPYFFHARYTLGLQTPPAEPSERLDLRLAGILLHEVVNEWHRSGGDPFEIFDRQWNQTLLKEQIAPGFRTAGYEMLLRQSLEAYVHAFPARPGWTVKTEEKVRLALDSIEIQGRVDRYDVGPGNACHVYDLKYIKADGLKRKTKKQDAGLLVQGGLYTLALEATGLRPESFSLIAARGEISIDECKGDDLIQLKQSAQDTTVDAAQRIYNGTIAPDPADEAACSYCDFADVCRISQAEAPAQKAGA